MLYRVILASIPIFAGVDRARLERLERRSVVRRVAAGAVVALYGAATEHLIVVEVGALAAFRETPDGRRLRLGEHPAPCAVDKGAVLRSGRYTATWIATVPSAVRLLPADELSALIDEVPAVRRHVLAHLAGRIAEREDELLVAAYGDTTARVATWLSGRAGEPGTRVPLPGAQEGLAQRLGATRVSVNRALRGLARAGLLRVEPGAVIVLDPDGLADRAL